MFKSIPIFICILIVNFSFSQDLNYSKKITKALEKAKKESKQVFVNYYSTNCSSSKKMKKYVKKDKIKSILNSNYVVVNIEIPKSEVTEYVTCSNPVKSFNINHCEKIKFPFWYTLDTSGRETSTSFKNKNEGFFYTNENINDFIELIETPYNTATSMLSHQKNNIAAK